jgi:hypothetical protein
MEKYNCIHIKRRFEESSESIDLTSFDGFENLLVNVVLGEIERVH